MRAGPAIGATDRPVTVKCRIGIDDQDTEQSLDRFADLMVEAGVDALYVHARKAWLNGLSPKENRTDPAARLSARLPAGAAPRAAAGSINGGIETHGSGGGHLAHVSGVMMGRAAYHDPMMLADVDDLFFGEPRAQ